jgi:hypothetical protein
MKEFEITIQFRHEWAGRRLFPLCPKSQAEKAARLVGADIKSD